MKTHKPLTRSCAVCGLEKPLSAFLQLGSKQGATYGTICASCRGAGLKEKTDLHDDERSSTSSNMRIGAKQRVEMEKQQKRETLERQTTHEESARKREQISLEKHETLDQKELAQKLRDKKQSFLNYQSKTQQPLSIQSMLNQKKDERLFVATALTVEKQQAFEAARLAETAKQEAQNTTLDLTNSGSLNLDQQISRGNPTAKALGAWLGADAPMMRTLSQLYKKTATTQKTPPAGKDQKETPREFAERILGPSSRKR